MATARTYMAARIREIRKARDLSTEELGARIGKSSKTIQAWERGLGQPDADKLVELCHVLDATILDFYEPGVTAQGRSFASASRLVPVLDSIPSNTLLRAAPLGGERYWAPSDILESHPEAFYLRIHDDSMNLKYPDGCLVLIDPNDREVRDGKIYAVCIGQDDAVLRQLFCVKSGIVMNPMSSALSPNIVTVDEGDPDAPSFEILGRAVWHVGVEE